MEKPILFNTDMVKAILEGRKTSTRRIVKPQPKQPIPLGFVIDSTEKKNVGCFGWGKCKQGGEIDYAKPPYEIGDMLYVRETWQEWTGGYAYKAGGDYPQSFIDKWKPSIHMPKEAARIFLKIISIRIERLQDITEKESKSEGASKAFYDNYSYRVSHDNEFDNYRDGFIEIWNNCYKWPQYWEANPWVWVIDFERVDK